MATRLQYWGLSALCPLFALAACLLFAFLATATVSQAASMALPKATPVPNGYGSPQPTFTSTALPTSPPTADATLTITPTINCNPTWRLVPSPNIGTGYNTLRGVAALSADDAWAVGTASNDNNNTTLTEHWNGSYWSVVPSPNSWPDCTLDAVAASSPEDVWAVGYCGDYTWGARALVEHWDGSTWRVVPSPTNDSPNDPETSALFGVAAVSANDVWAVGWQMCGLPCNLSVWILHWDGSIWREVPEPTGNSPSYLSSVVALSANDVWAVGNLWGVGTLIEHWDGSNWSIASSPNPSTDALLNGLAALSPNDIWAVGSFGGNDNKQTLVEHWDGTNWSILPSPNVGSGSNTLMGIAATAPDRAWAVGSYTNGTIQQTLVEQWDGNSWTVFQSPNLGQNNNSLRAVAGSSTYDVWAVGTYLNEYDGVNETLVARYTTYFTDVPPANLFYPYVQCLACRGIVTGYPDGTFRPNANVTRGQLAKIATLTAQYQYPIPPGQQNFQDVPPGNPFWWYIEQLVAHGIVQGYPCGGSLSEPCIPPYNKPYYRPAADANRGQTARVLWLIAGFGSPCTGQYFEDVPPGTTYYCGIQLLYEHGAVSGYPCGGPGEPCIPPYNRPYYRPSRASTRGQLAKMTSITFACSIPPNLQTDPKTR